MRLLAGSLLALLLPALIATAVVLVGGGEVRTRAFGVMLAVPVLWTLAMLYAWWDRSPGRAAAVLAALNGVSLVVVLAAEPLA